LAGDGQVDEREVSIREHSLSSPPPFRARTVESVAPAAAATPPKHFTGAIQRLEGAGVQFEEVPAMVDRPIRPSRVVEVDSPQFWPLWTFV
jgi:hypothetical protein